MQTSKLVISIECHVCKTHDKYNAPTADGKRECNVGICTHCHSSFLYCTSCALLAIQCVSCRVAEIANEMNVAMPHYTVARF